MPSRDADGTNGHGRARSHPRAPWLDEGDGVRKLGEELQSRGDEVLERTIKRAAESGKIFDGVVRESFEGICNLATNAVAGWMTTGSPEAGLKAGRGGWHMFGRLAAQRAAPLHEVTRRCLYWRDAAGDVLRDAARRDDTAPEALAQALSMLQLTVDFTLVRMCEVFETERRRTDEELVRRQEELAFMTTHDALTGLPNRTLMIDRGQQMLERARRHSGKVAALLIDLDAFKAINDTLGHAAGDELLRAVAHRFDSVIRGSDAFGRIGGDEFAVIADELSLEAGPELIAERLLDALSEPVTLASTQPRRSVNLTASIGIADGHRDTAEDLLRDADIAMYRAKWEGRNRFVVFEPSMHEVAQGLVELEMDLRDALDRDEFFLAYQPTFSLEDMRVTGMEALIRWQHPTRGVVQPSEFIPMLEETGMVCEVGTRVLHEACRRAAQWQTAGHDVGVSVNVSARQLDDDDLLAHVGVALADTGLNPAALTLEITETTLMRNADATAERLQAIKELGVRVAIDDFGTGYSSLAHLQRLPVDALKIDRSFVSRLSENPDGEALIHTLVQLARALSIETLAEGIERHDQLEILRRERCDQGQGFLFARPIEAAATEAFLCAKAAESVREGERPPHPSADPAKSPLRTSV
jgi:diguanylate cyclase (GGDEF)-like protein